MEERNKAIRTLRAEGVEVPLLARAFELSHERVYQICKGIKPKRTVTKEERKEIRQLYQQGLSVRDIADGFEMSKRLVKSFLGDLLEEKGSQGKWIKCKSPYCERGEFWASNSEVEAGRKFCSDECYREYRKYPPVDDVMKDFR